MGLGEGLESKWIGSEWMASEVWQWQQIQDIGIEIGEEVLVCLMDKGGGMGEDRLTEREVILVGIRERW